MNKAIEFPSVLPSFFVSEVPNTFNFFDFWGRGGGGSWEGKEVEKIPQGQEVKTKGGKASKFCLLSI